MEERGKIIVIEGTDGSGKATQTRLLHGRLNLIGIPTQTMSFPRYDLPSGQIIGGPYLGKPKICTSYYPDGPDSADPREASAYYAANRRSALPDIRKILESGQHLILDRYVPSNMGHQGGKIRDPDQRKKFYEALDALEYGFMQLPRPDLTVFLYMPYEMSMKLKGKQEKGNVDGHENNPTHMKNAEEAYVQLAEMYEWDKIDCAQYVNLNDPSMGIANIHEEVFRVVEKRMRTIFKV